MRLAQVSWWMRMAVTATNAVIAVSASVVVYTSRGNWRRTRRERLAHVSWWMRMAVTATNAVIAVSACLEVYVSRGKRGERDECG